MDTPALGVTAAAAAAAHESEFGDYDMVENVHIPTDINVDGPPSVPLEESVTFGTNAFGSLMVPPPPSKPPMHSPALGVAAAGGTRKTPPQTKKAHRNPNRLPLSTPRPVSDILSPAVPTAKIVKRVRAKIFPIRTETRDGTRALSCVRWVCHMGVV
jgi:hypothetical protein